MKKLILLILLSFILLSCDSTKGDWYTDIDPYMELDKDIKVITPFNLNEESSLVIGYSTYNNTKWHIKLNNKLVSIITSDTLFYTATKKGVYDVYAVSYNKELNMYIKSNLYRVIL